jgi:hypothetical protein
MIGSHGRRLLAGAVVSTVAARKKYGGNHFSYAELEETDEDLTTLRNWFAKIEHRDAFGAPADRPARTRSCPVPRIGGVRSLGYASEADGS